MQFIVGDCPPDGDGRQVLSLSTCLVLSFLYGIRHHQYPDGDVGNMETILLRAFSNKPFHGALYGTQLLLDAAVMIAGVITCFSELQELSTSGVYSSSTSTDSDAFFGHMLTKCQNHFFQLKRKINWGRVGCEYRDEVFKDLYGAFGHRREIDYSDTSISITRTVLAPPHATHEGSRNPEKRVEGEGRQHQFP
ncbi:DNA polymerase III subunit epsilon [Striga asiatica]|uniref:DNA polymerase III subunit epsilon n=1 Tax=Striga asiatica TaxID=4170 RepID=A0A5A7NZA4_STRAF|nr:DNA polymerase III subunit epsilon [Striga asiatica]